MKVIRNLPELVDCGSKKARSNTLLLNKKTFAFILVKKFLVIDLIVSSSTMSSLKEVGVGYDLKDLSGAVR